MNNLLVLLAFFALSALRSAETLPTKDEYLSSDLLSELKRLDKKYYVGKTVGLLMNNETAAKYRTKSFVDEPPGKLAYVQLKYSPNISLEVVVTHYRYLNPFSEHMRWDFKLFKKEIISQLRLVYKGHYLEIVK